MSSDYRMNLIWTSHGQQLRADLEANIAGLTNFDQKMGRSSNTLGMWGQQIRAVGTTLRYMFAGSVVYGVVTAVSSLSTFEAKLGDIEGLAAKIGNDGKVTRLGGMLNDLGDDALKASNKWGVAVGDIEDYMARFYSSFEPKGTQKQGMVQATQWANDIAQLTRALGGEAGDPGQLSAGIAGLIHGIPGGEKDIHGQTKRISNIIAAVTGLSPVIMGPDITRDIGRIGNAQVSTGMTPEEIFAVWTEASMKGGSSSVIGRGIAQLLNSSLMNPKTPANKQAFAEAGLPTTPNALREFEYKGKQGGMAVLLRMMDAIFPGGASKKTARILADEGTPDSTAFGAQGINLNLANKLFGRQESFRQVLAMLSAGSSGVLSREQKIREAEKNDLVAVRANIAVENATLQLGMNAQRNMTLAIVRGFDPIFHTLAKAAKQLSDTVIAHPDATTAVIGAAAGATVASRVFLGTGLFGLAGKGLMRIPGLGTVLEKNPLIGKMFGKVAGSAPQAAAAAVIGSGLGAFSSKALGTRTDPFWVVIDPLSWFMPGAPSGTSYGGTGNPLDPFSPGGRGNPNPTPSRRTTRLPWWAGAAAVTAGAAAVDVVPGLVQDHLDKEAEKHNKKRTIEDGDFPILESLSTRSGGGSGFSLGSIGRKKPTDAQQSILDQYLKHKIDEATAERRLQQLQTVTNKGASHGGGAGDNQFWHNLELMVQQAVTISLTPDAKKLLTASPDKSSSVPTKLWPNGQAASTVRGKSKNIRGKAG